MVANFKQGDLVWAKMKGFPPWPASVIFNIFKSLCLFRNNEVIIFKVTTCPKALADGSTSNIKFTVLFFGTQETAQMKANELFPYLDHVVEFGKNRKLKGFNEALKEIRDAAGISDDLKPDISKIDAIIPTSSTDDFQRSGSRRICRPSSRISSEDFILPSIGKTRALSRSIESNIVTSLNSINSAKSPLLRSPNNKRNRLRTESNCSTGSTGSFGKRTKRVSYSDKLATDFGLDYDPLLTTGVLLFIY